MSSDPTRDELEQWLEYWYPLVGLELTEPRAWIRGGLLEQPTYAEWAGVERTDVADLRQEPRMREELGMERRNTLPVCLVLVADPRSAPTTEQLALHALWPEATATADTVLYGLWLHKGGNILRPSSSDSTPTIPRGTSPASRAGTGRSCRTRSMTATS